MTLGQAALSASQFLCHPTLVGFRSFSSNESNNADISFFPIGRCPGASHLRQRLLESTQTTRVWRNVLQPDGNCSETSLHDGIASRSEQLGTGGRGSEQTKVDLLGGLLCESHFISWMMISKLLILLFSSFSLIDCKPC